MTDHDIKVLYNKYKMEEHKCNYREFITNLREFKFDPDNMYKEQYEGLQKEDFDMAKAEEILFGKAEQRAKGPVVLDIQRQDVTTAERVFARAQRVNRAIHRYFPTKKDFQDYIAKQINISGEECENKTVTQKTLNEVVSKLFANFDDKLAPRDFEGFLSCFTYNIHGEARITDISKAIYEYHSQFSLSPLLNCDL